MRLSPVLCLPALLLLSPVPALADTCDAVVADTVAEIRAGAGDTWNDAIERAVRAAAGSACVKASSGRYASTRTPAEDRDADGAVVQTAPVEADPPAEEAGDADGPADDGFDVGGLTIRGMSGSPGRKPYERQRDRARADGEESEDRVKSDGR